jgi:purine-nucleoside phosphorylase
MADSDELADLIRARTGGAEVRTGLVLGSGLGHLAESVDGVAIPYSDLPGFPHAGVSGHNPNLSSASSKGTLSQSWAGAPTITRPAIPASCGCRWRC